MGVSQYWVKKIQFPIVGSLVETRLLVWWILTLFFVNKLASNWVLTRVLPFKLLDNTWFACKLVFGVDKSPPIQVAWQYQFASNLNRDSFLLLLAKTYYTTTWSLDFVCKQLSHRGLVAILKWQQVGTHQVHHPLETHYDSSYRLVDEP